MTDNPSGWELPEYRNNPLIARLPAILSEDEAIQVLSEPPDFSEQERGWADHLRAHCIMRLGRYFLPLSRHLQLERHFSLLLRQGYIGRNPLTGDYLQHLRDGHEMLVHRDLHAGLGTAPSTASSFALIGCSGMGKTRTIAHILHLYPKVIRHSKPFSFDQVVWLKLESPYQGSPKQLCISFFQTIDLLLGTEYLQAYRRSSLDEMMVHMTQVARIHAVGVLVVDEIQHLNRARGTGKEDLLNFLVTLVNTIGIPVILIGTLGAVRTLTGDFRQARRASGLGSMVWERLSRADGWDYFVTRMWRYQWTQEHTPLTEEILECLYDESQGIIDVVIKLFMLAQMQVIQLRRARGRPETLDAKLFRHIAKENFKLISPMINALKRGDREAIIKYDDIRPFRDHIGDIFLQKIASLEPASMPAISIGPERATAPSGDPVASVRSALAGLNIAPDVAEAMLATAITQVGAHDSLTLMGAVMAQLQRPDATPMAQPRRKRPVKRDTPVMADDDLRAIVARGMESGLNGYQALAQAGVIRPVLGDFPV